MKNPHKYVTYGRDVISIFLTTGEYSYDAWLQLAILDGDSLHHVAAPVIRAVIE